MLTLAWPCGHDVEPDTARCMRCYRAGLYGTGELTRLEQPALFTPAPPQMPGQLGLDVPGT